MEIKHHPNVSEVLLPCSADKESVCDAGGPGSIPESGRSPGEGNGNPQCSCLENLTDRGAWWVTVHGVTESQIRPSVSSFQVEWWLWIHTWVPPQPEHKVTSAADCDPFLCDFYIQGPLSFSSGSVIFRPTLGP